MSGAATTDDVDAEEARALDGFASVVAPRIADILERVTRYVDPAPDSGEALACAYLQKRLGRAFQQPGGLAALASDSPRPLVTAPLREDFLLGTETYLHAALLLLREQTFAAYATEPEHCRLIIDLLHAIVHRFRLQLRDAVATAGPTCADLGHDPATGLPGLEPLLDRLDQLIEARSGDTQAAGVALAVISAGFPEQSALAGNADRARRELDIAQRIANAVRQGDFVGRVDHDNFAVVLCDVASPDIGLLAARKIKQGIDDESQDGSPAARALIGVACYPDHGLDAATLVKHAEIARETARGLPESISVYDPQAHAASRRLLSLEGRLRNALHENQLELYLQPKAELRSGRIFGAEALLRWSLDEQTWVPPAEIVALAERSGKGAALALWVINAALRQLAMLRSRGVAIEISINITAQNLLDPELPDFIEQSLRTWQLTAGDVVIELTENAMIGDSERAIRCLQGLKGLGLRLSIDDFGTGYSSLAYLTRMPIDELKIDQAFTRRMLRVQEDGRIVRSIIDLARHFDLKVVAEGVEELLTADSLRTLGCDAIQGYLLSQPVPPDTFAAWWLERGGVARELLG